MIDPYRTPPQTEAPASRWQKFKCRWLNRHVDGEPLPQTVYQFLGGDSFSAQKADHQCKYCWQIVWIYCSVDEYFDQHLELNYQGQLIRLRKDIIKPQRSIDNYDYI